jgi:hypothetical protein
MSDDATQDRLAAIEDRIEALRETMESCRKGMLGSRIAIFAGAVFFAVNLVGLISPPNLLVALLSFTAIIAGIVWLGANRTSREQAFASLRAAQAEWREATDAIDMSTVGE